MSVYPTTPVPGSLQKTHVDEMETARRLEEEFKLPMLESRMYIRLVTSERTFADVAKGLGVTHEREVASLAESMMQKGLVIRSSDPIQGYLPLHPRMVLSNVFKMFEKELVQSLRDHRATVDRVVNLLTPFYEENSRLREK